MSSDFYRTSLGVVVLSLLCTTVLLPTVLGGLYSKQVLRLLLLNSLGQKKFFFVPIILPVPVSLRLIKRVALGAYHRSRYEPYFDFFDEPIGGRGKDITILVNGCGHGNCAGAGVRDDYMHHEDFGSGFGSSFGSGFGKINRI